MTITTKAAAQRAGLDSANDSLTTRILQRYPATSLIIVPYVTLIIPQAIFYSNPHILVILYLVGLGLCGAGVIETIFLPLRLPYRQTRERVAANSRYPFILRVARPVAVIGVAADIIGAAAGGGDINTQFTGRVATSPLVPLMTPLSGWKYVALALFVSAFLGGLMTRRSLYRWVALMVAAQFVTTAYTAITAPMISFFSFLILSSLLFGLVRLRVAFMIFIALILAWPTIFAIRNHIREAKGIAVSTEITARDRLRFDEQISNVAKYEVPAKLPGLIGIDGAIRYGLVPRVLDPSRPVLATAGLISDYIGGSRLNSYSFLPLGNLYFLLGPDGVVISSGAWALFLVLLLRTGCGPGPKRLALVFVAIAGPLSWTNSYPESFVGYLQSLVGMLPVLLALRVFGGRDREKKADSSQRLPNRDLAGINEPERL